MSSVFITATGTDIGKTFVACNLLREWRAQGAQPHAIKPLMSGFGPSDLEKSDAGQLLDAMGEEANEASINRICLHRYEKPVAPNQAARDSGQTIDYLDILAFVNSRVLLAEGEPILVEGAGGIMSPVTDEKLHIDLISDLAMPTILVTANYLGSISHTLTALDVMKRRGVPVERVIVTRPTPEHGEPKAFIDELQRWSNARFEVA